MIRVRATQVGNMWPLEMSGGYKALKVAGKRLEEWQREMAPAHACVVENAWIGTEDWQGLEPGGKLVTVDGHLLGAFDEAALRDGEECVAGNHSRLIRYPWDVLFVNEQLVGALRESTIVGEVNEAAQIEGKVIIGEGTRILSGVYIEGNAVIGKHCKIGPNCYIRGNTTIGDDCHIGQAVEVKNALLGDKTWVGHLSYIGDSIVGDDVNIGAGTITSNYRHDGGEHWSLVDGKKVSTGRLKFGSVIGNGVRTGIHTSIYPGRKIGAGCALLPNAVVIEDLPR